ncbi:MAG TPA: carboxypeptidase regulatory-like domain-containing protein, partial [Gemmatimonadales bacterium]|nr:carboxypeptidase regulatory-like domain-containing protein [Gemmatimonadales bacterium]
MKSPRYLIGAFLALSAMVPLRAQAQSGTIRGKVTNDVAGTPLAGAAVWFGTRIVQTRADGQYVITGAPVGTGTLHARLIGFTAVSKTITVVAGQTLD